MFVSSTSRWTGEQVDGDAYEPGPGVLLYFIFISQLSFLILWQEINRLLPIYTWPPF